MISNRLLMNSDTSKTEVLLIGTRQQLSKVNFDNVKVCSADIAPSPQVKNLGVWFDSNLSLSVHITTLRHFAIFIILGNYKGMYRNSLIHAFIFSKLDYCNSLLYGAPNYLFQKMQRVQNAAERESNFSHWKWH